METQSAPTFDRPIQEEAARRFQALHLEAPESIVAHVREPFDALFAAAQALFDNRLGWGEGRNPYAPRETWADLGAVLYGKDDARVIELRLSSTPLLLSEDADGTCTFSASGECKGCGLAFTMKAACQADADAAVADILSAPLHRLDESVPGGVQIDTDYVARLHLMNGQGPTVVAADAT